MSRKFYTVDFCTGDDQGAFTGFVEAVEIWEHSGEEMEALIELTPHVWDEEARQWLGLPFGYNTNANGVVRSVTIAGETFPILGGPRFGGNWSWDSVTMRLNEICRLLNHLKASRHHWPSGESCQMFDIDQGTEKFWMWWEGESTRFKATARAPRWFRVLPRKRRRKFNRQLKRNLCLSYKL